MDRLKPATVSDVRALAREGRLEELADVLRGDPDRLARYAAAEALAGMPSAPAESR